ncbi:chemotaxis protein CheB [Sphingomonas sp.]|uniref:chemotaxis protein CheB n=1 Tax=Sphingomonas sp. TaxID=28214 RepID=UPI000DB23976|nr:chemotaxis protein CheB [Sphingomonas sp.]PZU11618.1 MAG: chemotaxis response regulator protein-glutamate methylesterase [Sphingomonas sp.]
MIVEDSPVVQALLTHIIGQAHDLEVAGAFASAEEALAALPAVRPDIISMDIRLPGMDGLEATRRIMAERPTPIVVISASVEKESLGRTMEALSSGALSVVEKPVGISHADYAGVAQEIRTQLRIMADVPVVRRRLRSVPLRSDRPGRQGVAPKLIVCAASTGGPQALARLFAVVPPTIGLPVLLVQHMGVPFMEGFARWLDGVLPWRVAVATAGERLEPGTILVAPGDHHLRLDRTGHAAIDREPALRGQRPAATALFESAAAHAGAAAIGVMLTGMGEDGAPGVRALLAAGAPVFAEDRSSAIVYGMPAAAVREGATAVPLDKMGDAIARAIGRAGARA